MVKYVKVSDLILNGGDGCAMLHRAPAADHIVIAEDDSAAAHLGSVMISHNGDTLVWRTMRDDIMDDQRWLTVGDLNTARRILCRDRLDCWKCKHFQYGHCWAQGDTWSNFKNGCCPKKVV